MVQTMIMITILILVLSKHNLINSNDRNACSIEPFNIACELMRGTEVAAMALTNQLQLQCGGSVAMEQDTIDCVCGTMRSSWLRLGMLFEILR